MSEQKYYVKLVQTGLTHSVSYQLYLWEYDEKYSYQSIEYDKKRNPERLYRYQFTKSELAEIMDGAFYKQTLAEDCIPVDHVYYGDGKDIVSEWINPLIELIEVDDENIS